VGSSTALVAVGEFRVQRANRVLLRLHFRAPFQLQLIEPMCYCYSPNGRRVFVYIRGKLFNFNVGFGASRRRAVTHHVTSVGTTGAKMAAVIYCVEVGELTEFHIQRFASS